MRIRQEVGHRVEAAEFDERGIEARAQGRRPFDGRFRRQECRDEGFELFAGRGNLDVSALQGALHERAQPKLTENVILG